MPVAFIELPFKITLCVKLVVAAKAKFVTVKTLGIVMVNTPPELEYELLIVKAPVGFNVPAPVKLNVDVAAVEAKVNVPVILKFEESATASVADIVKTTLFQLTVPVANVGTFNKLNVLLVVVTVPVV